MKRNRSLTFAVIGAVACVVGATLFEILFPAKAVPVQATRALSVALLIDTSGSMRTDNKIEEVRRAASDYVRRQQNAPDVSGVAVVRFSGDARVVSPLSKDEAAQLSAISEFEASGATEMADGLRAAGAALIGTDSGATRTILLFTDGAPDSDRQTPEEARGSALSAAQNLRASGVKLLAVGTSDADLDFLGQLTGDANLVFPTTTGNFAEAFQRADRASKQLFSGSGGSSRGFLEWLLLGGFVTFFLGCALLVAENTLGLRGRPWRDLSWVAPISAVLGVGGALFGQALFALLPDNAPSRAVAWALVGAVAGVVLGLADRSQTKALRGAIGGAVGGYLGGFVFAVLSGAFQNGALELFGRLLGFAVLGFAIGMMLQLVQQALKTAWLTGITTGPYEGKQYILSKPIVTVGRSDGNDIGLYREASLALKLGAFQFETGRWRYAGAAVEINGTSDEDALLTTGDTLKFGGTAFLFEERGGNATPEPKLEAEPTPEPEPIEVSSQALEPTVATPMATPIQASIAPAAPRAASAKRWRLFGEELLELPLGRITLGRSEDNRVCVPQISISAHHAMLEVTPNALFVTDLGSTNGTMLNGAKLPEGTPTPLNDGDQLTLGALQFRVMS